MSYLDSPSGRKSSRRALYALAVAVGCACVLVAVALDRDIRPGVVTVLGTLIASTATSVVVGRFAEKGTERLDGDDARNDEARGER